MASGEVFISYMNNDDTPSNSFPESSAEELNIIDSETEASHSLTSFLWKHESVNKVTHYSDQKKSSSQESSTVPTTAASSEKKLTIMIPQKKIYTKQTPKILPKLQEYLLPGYFPISVQVKCMPCESYHRPVNISLPIWCCTDDSEVEVEVRCQEANEHKLISTAKLKDLDNEIKFQSLQLTSFTAWIDEKFLTVIKFSINMDMWKRGSKDFVVVAFANDSFVKNNWMKELREKGYEPTQVTFNPLLVHHNDKIHVSLSTVGSTQRTEKFCIDGRYPYPHFVKFDLHERSLSGTCTLLKCVVNHQTTRKVWIEEIKSDQETKTTPKEKKEAAKERIEDVFHDEIIPAVYGGSWTRFATSSKGLCLSLDEYQNISHDNRSSIEAMKLETLQTWRKKLGYSDSDAIKEIRQLVENFQKMLQEN